MSTEWVLSAHLSQHWCSAGASGGLDQRAQLMLALGTLGAALERGHPQQERALATLHAAFDEALAERVCESDQAHKHRVILWCKVEALLD